MLSAVILFALAAPPAPDLEAEKARVAVAVAVAIAKANEKKPAPKVDPTPAVVVTRPFTQGGTRINAQRAGAISSASPGISRTDNIPIHALTTAPYGAIRCVSYG